MANTAVWIQSAEADLSDGKTTNAVSKLLEIVKSQEERHQQAAKALDELAKAIGYPINSQHEMRKRVRAIAAIVRGDKGNGDVGDR